MRPGGGFGLTGAEAHVMFPQPMRHAILLPLAALLLLLAASVAQETATATVRVAWDPNPEPDIAGYTLYWTPDPEAPFGEWEKRWLPGAPEEPRGEAVLATGAVYTIAVTASNTAGLESLPSNTISIDLTLPTVPARFRAKIPAAGGEGPEE